MVMRVSVDKKIINITKKLIFSIEMRSMDFDNIGNRKAKAINIFILVRSKKTIPTLLMFFCFTFIKIATITTDKAENIRYKISREYWKWAF
jgi:hypothetical protein